MAVYGYLRRYVLTAEECVAHQNPGDTVHVILTSSTGLDNLSTPLPHHDMPIEISASRNYIILHPDLLISATLISQTSYCARRPIIASLVSNSNFDPEPSSSKANVSLANVWGNFVHEIVQKSLRDALWDNAAITSKVDNLLKSPRGIAELFRAGINIEQAKREISQRTQGLSGFGKRYMCTEPRVRHFYLSVRAGL
jgi:DNA replication ATP-dependent helicase Dna2